MWSKLLIWQWYANNKMHKRWLTLALSTDEPVSFSAGTGVATCRVDADLGGVTVMGVCLTFINVWNKEKSRE